MRRGVSWWVFVGLGVSVCGQILPASTVGVYFNQADWQAAMSLNGTNPLTTINFNDTDWTQHLQILPQSRSEVSQSSTAASNGMNVTIDSQCGAPGACVQLGQVANGEWTDSLEKYSGTTFNFGSPIYGFGGDFNIASDNGLFIAPLGQVPYSYFGGGSLLLSNQGYEGFIGIITDQPMNNVFISWGDNGSCYQCFGNAYTLSDFQVATLPTPEPNFKYTIAGLLLLGLCFRFARR